MARPLKEGLDYFPHDVDASQDEKIEAFEALFGNDGYAFFFKLCERIYRSGKGFLDISQPETLIVLAKRVGVRKDKFQRMLEKAKELGLFDKELANNFQQLTSNGIRRRTNIVLEDRLRMRGKRSLSTEQTTEQTTEQMPQSKVKESKVISTPVVPQGTLVEKTVKENFELPDWIKKETWSAFLEVRRRKRAPDTAYALKLIIRKLEKMRAAGDNPNEVLEQSIMPGWTGVFPLKGGGNGRTDTAQPRARQFPKAGEYTVPPGQLSADSAG